MKTLFYTFLIYFLEPCSLFSQNIIAEYDYYFKKDSSEVTFHKPATLSVSENISLFAISGNENGTTKETIQDKDGGNHIVLNSNKSKYFYKDLKSRTITSTEKIITDRFNVLDSLDIFNWEIQDSDTKLYLGYTCKKARLNYRGREYFAYFTSDIPIQNGPFKFHGLPGLILYIETIGKGLTFKIEVTKLQITNKDIKIQNPFTNKKIITWKDYCETYTNKYYEIQEYNKTGGQVNFSMPKGYIEIIINE